MNQKDPKGSSGDGNRRVGSSAWTTEIEDDDWDHGTNGSYLKELVEYWLTGSAVTEQLARSHARSLVGVHVTDVPFWHLFQKPMTFHETNGPFSTEMTNGYRRRGRTR